MYIPSHFSADDTQIAEILASITVADLVTVTGQGLVATLLPLLYTPETGSLRGHVARNNEQWSQPALGEALVIVRGPEAYVSPGWYAGKAEHGRVVPTWNYVTAHVYGQLVVHDDPAWVEELVRQLTSKHEAGMAHPWSADDAPERYLAGQLRAIVGVELVISRVEAKIKLSQNRSEADIDGVIAGLSERGETAAAEAMQAVKKGKGTS